MGKPIPFEVYVTNDIKFISKYAAEMFKLIVKSYAKHGSNISIHTVDDITQKSSIAKLVFNDDGKIIALALYRDDLGGHKRFASATNKNDSRYREAAEAIVQNDIEPYDNWFWVEASDKIEEFFKKHNGNPIPNHLVYKFLRKPKKDILKLHDDGVHYDRMISSNDSVPATKMMFGFKSKEAVNVVMQRIDNYDQFKINVNESLNDLFEDEDNATEETKSFEAASIFIQELSEKHDDGFNEMLPSWRDQLKMAIARILKEKKTHKHTTGSTSYIEANLNTAKYLIQHMPLLKVHQLHL